MHSMNYIGKFFSNFKVFYNDINAATLTGAIDVIVVEQPDGTFNCSPFHVRFGKLGVLRSREKVVDIEINGEPQDIHMKLGESGEAFFVEELEDDDNELPEHLATSPIPMSQFDSNDLFETASTIEAKRLRRASLDSSNTKNLILDENIIKNELNEYKKRRNTADNDDISTTKLRERHFIQRQIDLGNLDIVNEQLTKPDFLPTKNANDEDETIFTMDNIEETLTTTTTTTATTKIGKKKRRKTKKKNAPRKSSSINQLPINETVNNEKTTESATDPSSTDSNSSDPELKEIQKIDNVPILVNQRKIIDPDFHFFSDTELTTNNLDDLRNESNNQIESVQSDSEFEVKNRKGDNKNNGQSWEWGGFPSLTPNNSPVNDETTMIKTNEDHQSVISNMFSFMKRNHGQLNDDNGIYLSDLNSDDPEVTALYFSKANELRNEVDMDCESGNGPSLAQSPNSAEGCKSIDSDFDDHYKGSKRFGNDVSMSLCGWDPEPDTIRFDENLVTFSDFCNNPMLIENPNLVILMHGKYYNWKVAAPIISSIMVFNRPLLQSTVDQLCNLHMPNQNKTTKQEQPQEHRSWWNWGRSKSSRETTPMVDVPTTSIETEIQTDKSEIVTSNQSESMTNVNLDNDILSTADNTSQTMTITNDKFKKTLRLSSKQIKMLNLRDGMNEIVFSVTTAYQGTTRCICNLYKWKYDDKIVISDIDGTITKSDVLGHILPIVGKDWAQSGVAQLFNKIYNNGYKLLYLSARAIGQARITREYLKSIKQDDLTMPDGPILLNPTSLITAFHREVIEKKPEQFKISCMSDIKALFPIDSEPFYAGYGNRINDVWAYRAVGIPIMRIFTINPKGELKHELTQTFQSSYLRMTSFVDQLFPPLIEAANDYSQFTYWRDPLQTVEELPEIA